MNDQNSQGMQALIPENKSPVFEPGPGWGAKFKKNFTKRILPLIAVLVVVIGLIMFLGRDRKETGITPEGEPQIQETESISVEKVVTQEGQQEFIYKATAQKGEGTTHLARRSLREYLNASPLINSDLKSEHKIYIEDYLKDLHGERFLGLGEKVEFSANEISRAIEMARGLSSNQLKNLSQYVSLVSGL